MNKFGAVCSVIIMLLAAIAGLFAGVYLNSAAYGGCNFVCGYCRLCVRYIQRKRTAVMVYCCPLFDTAEPIRLRVFLQVFFPFSFHVLLFRHPLSNKQPG